MTLQAARPHDFTVQEILNRVFDSSNNRLNTNIAALLAQANTWTAIQTFTAALLVVQDLVFPATQVASADANTLDDYEEGTWTPVLGGSGGQSGQTYAEQSGTYTKIGRHVLISCTIRLTAKGTITTNLQISGLPFASGATYSWSAAARPSTLAVGWAHVHGILLPSVSVIRLDGFDTLDTTSTILTTTDVADATQMRITIAYHV
tara:strand:- start:429 stop:1043 length:615 start_codon:yes stop_codon:yes gene_type:complete